MNKAQQGFADTGLFDSGARYREEGLLARESGDILSDYNRRAALKEKGLTTGLSRTLEDVGLQSKIGERDIERGRFTDIETRASDLAKTAGQQYVTEFSQTLPPELQANTQFDLLKQIGIYS